MKGRFENPLYKEIRQIQFTEIAAETKRALPANRGYFQFSIPSGKQTKMIRNVLVSPTKIETMPSGDYTYTADLMTGQNGKGTLILLKEKGKIFGSMTLNDRVFRIEHLESGEQILIELNQEILLNVSNLNQGMYQLIVLINGSEYGSKRLIIQR